MEKKDLKCVICKEQFTPRDKRQVTCSDEECKRSYQNMVRQMKRAGIDPKTLLLEKPITYTAEQLQKMSDRAKWKVMTIAQRNEFARTHGMTYGKMDARMRMEV